METEKQEIGVIKITEDHYQINLSEHKMVCLQVLIERFERQSGFDLIKVRRAIHSACSYQIKNRPDFADEMLFALDRVNESLITLASNYHFLEELQQKLSTIKI